MKIIQLGLTFADEHGNFPATCTWQFNFTFNLSEDMYAQDSIDLLKNSGIDFQKFERDGIDVADFGELLMTSGLVLNSDIKWISFHSGYDFGYLLKLLTCSALPADEPEFFKLMQLYFPCIYDIKYMMKSWCAARRHRTAATAAAAAAAAAVTHARSAVAICAVVSTTSPMTLRLCATVHNIKQGRIRC